jgi:hypothetical protein
MPGNPGFRPNTEETTTRYIISHNAPQKYFPMIKYSSSYTRVSITTYVLDFQLFSFDFPFHNPKFHGDDQDKMEDNLETRSISNNVPKLSENIAESPAPLAGGAAVPKDDEETYPPAQEVIPILLALASTIFLVSLVSSSSLCALRNTQANLDSSRIE